MLRDLDVSKFYVHDESLAERGLTTDDLVMEVEVVSGAQIAEILEQAHKVLPF
jgi:tRNA 2-thiouridine synthesizing protein C